MRFAATLIDRRHCAGGALVSVLLLLVIIGIASAVVTNLASGRLREVRIIELRAQQKHLAEYYATALRQSAAWEETLAQNPDLAAHLSPNLTSASTTTARVKFGPRKPISSTAGLFLIFDTAQGLRLNRIHAPITSAATDLNEIWQLKAYWTGVAHNNVIVEIEIRYLGSSFELAPLTIAITPKQCVLISKRMTLAAFNAYHAGTPALQNIGWMMANLTCPQYPGHPEIKYRMQDIRANIHPASAYSSLLTIPTSTTGLCAHPSERWHSEWTPPGLSATADGDPAFESGFIPTSEAPPKTVDLATGVLAHNVCYATCCAER